MSNILDVDEIPTWGTSSLNLDPQKVNLRVKFFNLHKDEEGSNEYESNSTPSNSNNSDESDEDLMVYRIQRGNNALFGHNSHNNTIHNNSLPHLEAKFEPNFEINSKVSVWKGDITKIKIDCIVNSTSFEILHGSGVTRSIIASGGPDLIAECRKVRGCGAGEACITKGYKLPAKHVIHTVGPSREAEHILKACYNNCLNAAANLKPPAKSIAFPCISTGAKQYPNLAAAHVALNSVSSWLRAHPGSSIKRVIFCTFLELDTDIYHEIIPIYFPVALPCFDTFSLQ